MIMDNYNVCFEKLSRQFDKSIKRECMIFKGKASDAELYNTALIALWYADTTYRKEPLNFEIYVICSIHEALKAYIQKNRLGGCFFSLNRQIGRDGSTVEAITTVQAPSTDWDIHIMVSILIPRLNGMEKKVACALLGKSTAADIRADYQLSQEELNHILTRLRDVWITLFGMT